MSQGLAQQCPAPGPRPTPPELLVSVVWLLGPLHYVSLLMLLVLILRSMVWRTAYCCLEMPLLWEQLSGVELVWPFGSLLQL